MVMIHILPLPIHTISLMNQKKDLRSAHILCSNYSELRNLKSALNDALDYAPKGAPSPLSSSLMDFLTQLQTFASYIAYAQIEAIYIS